MHPIPLRRSGKGGGRGSAPKAVGPAYCQDTWLSYPPPFLHPGSKDLFEICVDLSPAAGTRRGGGRELCI